MLNTKRPLLPLLAAMALFFAAGSVFAQPVPPPGDVPSSSDDKPTPHNYYEGGWQGPLTPAQQAQQDAYDKSKPTPEGEVGQAPLGPVGPVGIVGPDPASPYGRLDLPGGHAPMALPGQDSLDSALGEKDGSLDQMYGNDPAWVKVNGTWYHPIDNNTVGVAGGGMSRIASIGSLSPPITYGQLMQAANEKKERLAKEKAEKERLEQAKRDADEADKRQWPGANGQPGNNTQAGPGGGQGGPRPDPNTFAANNNTSGGGGEGDPELIGNNQGDEIENTQPDTGSKLDKGVGASGDEGGKDQVRKVAVDSLEDSSTSPGSEGSAPSFHAAGPGFESLQKGAQKASKVAGEGVGFMNNETRSKSDTDAVQSGGMKVKANTP